MISTELGEKMDILKKLHLSAKNIGTSTGANWWSTTTNEGEIVSYNPTTGEEIASVYNCSASDYEHVLKTAHEAYQVWQTVPSPKRGELIRLIGDELRKH